MPFLLNPEMQQSLDILVSKRQECGPLNVYLFTRPSAMTCYCGSDCLRHFPSACGARDQTQLSLRL